jgi:DNA-directed RNA polymerase subunit RPC12/RpoP
MFFVVMAMKCSNCGSKLNAWSWRTDLREGNICPRCGQRNPSLRTIQIVIVGLLAMSILQLYQIYTRNGLDTGGFLVSVTNLTFLALFVLMYKWRRAQAKLPQYHQLSKSAVTIPQTSMLVLTAKNLVPLVLGVVLFLPGVVLIEIAVSDVNLSEINLEALLLLGVISLCLGILFLVASFRVRRQATDSYLPESTTMLALSVAIEFLVGAGLVLVGIGNLSVSSSGGLPWALAMVTVLGVLFMTDSVLFYRRNFKHVAETSKAV